MSEQMYRRVNGKANVNNGAASATVIAAQGTGKVIRLTWGVVTITVAATGGGGLVSIKDGTTVIQSYPANTLDTYYIEYGDDGFPLTANSALNIVVEGAATTQATAFISVCGNVIG